MGEKFFYTPQNFLDGVWHRLTPKAPSEVSDRGLYRAQEGT